MDIQYKENKEFSKQQIEELFVSVNWISGRYPERVVRGNAGTPLRVGQSAGALALPLI